MDFASWLDQQGYSVSTRASTLRVVKRAVEVYHEGGDLMPYTSYLKRVAAWAKEHPPAEPTDFLVSVSQRFSPPSTDSEARGLNRPQPEPLNEAEWNNLRDVIDGGGKDPKWRALGVLISFPFPARDLHRNLHEDLSELCQLASPDVLRRLQTFRRTGCKNIAEYIGAPERRTSYDILRRMLSGCAAEIGRSRLTFSDIEATPWDIRK